MKLIKSTLSTLFTSAALLGANLAMAENPPTSNFTSMPSTLQAGQTEQNQIAKSVDKVNINTVTAEELKEILVGIGQKKAEAIVKYREEYGPFKALEQLLEVKGFGKATLEKNKERIEI